MHALQKILAAHAGVSEVKTGDMITAEVDLAEVNDLYLQVIKSFQEMGGVKVWDPEKVTFIFDHFSPASTIKAAENHRQMREFCFEQHIPHLFDIDCGVCHQVMPEHGLVRPGMVLVATDSHTTTHGAFGAFGTGVGATDLATILITGKLWFRVPEIINIRINGTIPPGVMGKDLVLKVLGELGQDIAVYKGIEYSGPAVEGLSLAERMVLCNMAVEMGAKTAYIQPGEEVLAYVRQRYGPNFTVYETDPGFEYDAVYDFDASDIEPQVALPHSVDNVKPVSAVAPAPINQVFIGTCTGGRVDDIAAAVKILKGHHIPPHTRLVVMPASKEVLKESISKGYIQDLMESGATISAPGCGPCLGVHQGLLADGESCVTTSSRNFPGRMGSVKAEIYIASPATAAATAREGKLADPRKYL